MIYCISYQIHRDLMVHYPDNWLLQWKILLNKVQEKCSKRLYGISSIFLYAPLLWKLVKSFFVKLRYILAKSSFIKCFNSVGLIIWDVRLNFIIIQIAISRMKMNISDYGRRKEISGLKMLPLFKSTWKERLKVPRLTTLILEFDQSQSKSWIKVSSNTYYQFIIWLYQLKFEVWSSSDGQISHFGKSLSWHRMGISIMQPFLNIIILNIIPKSYFITRKIPVFTFFSPKMNSFRIFILKLQY